MHSNLRPGLKKDIGYTARSFFTFFPSILFDNHHQIFWGGGLSEFVCLYAQAELQVKSWIVGLFFKETSIHMDVTSFLYQEAM